MSKTYLISSESIKTFFHGALGAMSFGAYHQYTTNKIMELNNEKVEIQHKYFMDKMEHQHKKEMNDMENNQKLLNQKLEKIENFVSQRENQNRWW
jgi:adenosylmethionine-8-amino-7-oxononanoate aminotransferase